MASGLFITNANSLAWAGVSFLPKSTVIGPTWMLGAPVCLLDHIVIKFQHPKVTFDSFGPASENLHQGEYDYRAHQAALHH